MKNLILRSISGCVYVALICTCVLVSGYALEALIAFFTIAGLYEFHKLCDKAVKTSTLLADMAGGLGLSMVFCISNFRMETLAMTALIILFLYIIIRPTMQLYVKGVQAIDSLAHSFMGLIYVALPLGMMCAINSFNDGKYLLLGMFIMIWMSDTGAFLVGSAIGRHKLFPRISPNKSWEGFIGGLLFSVLSAIVLKYVFPDYYWSMSMVALCGMGLIVSIFATWGDLIESMIKRTVCVKDSGNLIPGHGGILDRIDSLLLASPATLFYLIIITFLT